MNEANQTVPVRDVLLGAVARPARHVRASLSALAFWGAIALPAIYLPMLLAGIHDARGLAAFLSLFALHVVTLAGGRGYHRAG